MSNTFENEYVTLRLEKDILFVYYKPNSIITLDAAKKVVEDRLDFANNTPKYVIAEVSNIKNSSKEAREFLSKKDGGLKGILAGAFVSDKVYSYFILNLFLKLISPSIPAKYFMDEQSALRWVSELKNSKSNYE